MPPTKMGAELDFDGNRGLSLRGLGRLRPVWWICILFVTLLVVQALGFFFLGIGRAGAGVSEGILVIDNVAALICAWFAFRRAHGIAALFWFLFGIVALVLLVPTALQAYDTIFDQTTLSDSNRALLYCLYGAPVLMMLFLPETHQAGRVKSEIALDLFQVAIVVSLIYSTFFFLPVQRMLPADAALRNISISDVQSLLLLIAGFVRLQFARVPATRNLLLRLTLFLMVCAVVTFIGDWVDLHYHLSSAWFDLGWAVPVIAGSLIAFTWTPAPVPQFPSEPANFVSFLGTNLVLVAMLSCLALLTDRWKQAYGGMVTNVAVAASLVALTLRLALTQFHQYEEITSRKAAQKQLALSNEKIVELLEVAQRKTVQITRINELGTMLQACATREEALRVLAERMEPIFPGVCGTLSILNSTQTRAEIVAEWGGGAFDRDPAKAGGEPASRRENRSSPDSISIPLIAHNEPIGVLTMWRLGGSSSEPQAPQSVDRARLLQLASALAEHIALTIVNLDLRAALLVQAIRDPLTGLYNRRYMQEALERELHRARRRERPLSVMMLDIDHFKKYNDTFGHAAGDDALRMVAETLISSIRAEDFACRYGGEEFVVILPECALPQAAIRAEEVRRQLRELYAERPGELPELVTVSIGVAGFQETTGKIDALLKFADDALYRAKHEGRDRVVVASPELSDPHRSPTYSSPRDPLEAVLKSSVVS